MQLPPGVLELMQRLVGMTTDNGAMPSEAAKAADKLQQLLSTHQLTIADIPNRKVGEDIVENCVFNDYVRAPKSYGTYANLIARAWSCVAIGGQGYVKFVGYESDVKIATFFFDTTYSRLRDEGTKQGRSLGLSSHDLRSYVDDFVVGAGSAVRKRLREFGADKDQQCALVRIKDDDVEQHVSDNYCLRGGRSYNTRSDGGFGSGQRYGNTMEIVAGVAGSCKTPTAIQ